MINNIQMKNLLLTLVIFFYVWPSAAQQADFVKDDGINSPLHKANTGKIIFTSKAVTLEKLKETDFITQSDLTNKSSLFISVFMDKSLTNYMHQLAPELSKEELYKAGNYQFSFYVDNQLIYRENIHYGAGLPAHKDNQTVLIRPFLSYPNRVGWWSEYMWERFKNNGGNKALTEGKHVFKLEIRPYVNLKEIKVGDLIASGEIELNVKLPKIDISKIQLNQVKSYPGFEISKEHYDADKIKLMWGNVDEAVFKSITSVVVIKNGKLLIEEYFNGADRNSRHDPRSVGKSFASTMAGIAIHEKYLKSEDVPLKAIYDLKKFQNYSVLKDNTTVRDLLTMSSVFDGNDDHSDSPGNEENMYPTADWVKFTLDLPADTALAKKPWHYFTAGVVLLGDIIHQKVPGGLEKYADEKLFKPLGITQYQWQHTPQNVANTAGGIQMNSLDFAKYGQLYKNRGVWNKKQVIPQAWVDKTFTKHKSIPGRTDEYYGYLFWNKKYMVDNKAYETFYCTGNGGNKIFIFKDQPLVVVITATAYGAGYAHAQADKMMQDYILPAVIDK
jgi:CubicO group peptidase (beta-lactamase class C family)